MMIILKLILEFSIAGAMIAVMLLSCASVFMGAVFTYKYVLDRIKMYKVRAAAKWE